MTGQKFESVSVILPVINETWSLEKTVEVIMADCQKDIKEFIIVICDKTILESRKVCEQIKNKYGDLVKIIKQKRPFLGGALRDAFDKASASHVLMMASDLETPPEEVKNFIEEAKRHPKAIIAGSRWLKGGGFQEYNFLKYLLNFVFQNLFSWLYRTKLTDMTYGFRLFPTSLLKVIRWEELRHPFLFETIIKPLRLGVEVREIPIKWRARKEGSSQNTFFRNFEYFRIGLKSLFYSRDQILL
jgi:glycosyltransferase involved in cell wall biosynthesis